MRDAIVYIGEIDDGIYTQSLRGVLNAGGQADFMEDRVLWTEEQIGEMDRNKLNVVELTRSNTVYAAHMVTDISFLGYDAKMNNMPKYAVTVTPAGYIPRLAARTTARTRQSGCPYMMHRYAHEPFEFVPASGWRSPEPAPKTGFTAQEAMQIAKALGIDFTKERFDLNQFIMGLNTELEHGRKYYPTNVTQDDPLTTGKIALAHLREFPDYYTRLAKLEEEAKAYWATHRYYRETRVFTLSELSQYDGTMGKPAYVAVNGIVYDVTGNSKWSGGRHFSGLTAGKDLSSQFEGCHGMGSILAKLPKVGLLK